MFGIGMPEMILILAVALIVIGPKKLPDLAKSLGKAMGEFKKATSDLKASMQIDTELKEVKTAFNDITREDKKDSQKYTREGSDKTVDSAAAVEKPEAVASEEDAADRLEPLKTTFDSRTPDAPNSDSSAPGANPDSETRKGQEK